MYSYKNLLFIFTILEAIEKIEIYTKKFEDEEEFYYANEQLNFNGVVSLLIAIGEENKKIDEQIKNDYPFEWREISKMRDKISHNYRGVSPFVVWDIIKNHLLDYKKLLVEILPNIEEFEEALDDALNSSYYTHLNYLKNV
jgi:uncharacterized protein with HEPN domain